TQLADLLLQRLDPCRLLRRGTRPGPVIDVGLLHPVAQRLRPDPQLGGDPLDGAVIGPQLLAQLADRPHRPLLFSLAVTTRVRLPRRQLLWHDSILDSKPRSLQGTQWGSTSHTAQVVDEHAEGMAKRRVDATVAGFTAL